jgi:hypothetical protein
VRIRPAITPAWISRAKLCASGRNSSVDAPSRKMLGSTGIALAMSE